MMPWSPLLCIWRALPVFVLAILSVESAVLTEPTQVAAAWYAGVHATEGFPVSDISWSKYTHLSYSFAETTSSVEVLSLDKSNPGVLPYFVDEAHKHGVKALITIGGWTGSRGFSYNVGSAQNRTAFVKTVIGFVKKYNMDGVDFDWEYPGKQGIGCNAVSKNDTANFLLFLQELREDSLGSKLILTAATAVVPFTGSDGNPLGDVSEFSQVFDYLTIMNYDIWGSWSTGVGPNTPLNDTCASTQNQAGSAVSAVQKWHNAGIPLTKIVLGVAAYGHSFRVRKADAFVAGSTSMLASYPKFDAKDRPTGDSWSDPATVDECGTAQPTGGTMEFWGMMDLGYLNLRGTPESGIFYRYDNCSQTPYVYNAENEVMVSYDNAESFVAKGKFIRETGIRGFGMWEAGGDWNDILLNAIRKAGGYPEVEDDSIDVDVEVDITVNT